MMTLVGRIQTCIGMYLLCCVSCFLIMSFYVDWLQLPGQAHTYELAHLHIPNNADDRENLRKILINRMGNCECLMKVEYYQNDIGYISIYHANTKENLLELIAKNGCVTIKQDDSDRYDISNFTDTESQTSIDVC
jgi:hypothetical protein